MQQEDEYFCRLDVNFVLHDPRWLRLSSDAKVLYLEMWATAVSERRERLPKMYDLDYFARLLGISRDVMGRSLAELLPKKGRSGLVRRDRSRRISVSGVRSKHKRLPWKDDPPSPTLSSPYPATRARQRREDKDKDKDPPLSKPPQKPVSSEEVFLQGEGNERPWKDNALLEFCEQVTAATFSPSAKIVSRSKALVNNHKGPWCLKHAKEVVQDCRRRGKVIGDANYILAALENIGAKEAVEETTSPGRTARLKYARGVLEAAEGEDDKSN